MSLRVKRGDTFPFQYVISYDDGTPIDLTGATVTLTIILDGETEPTVDEGVCSLVNSTGGIVQYTWQSGDTDVSGMYKLEFRVTFNNSAKLTIPSNDILWLYIVESTRPMVV